MGRTKTFFKCIAPAFLLALFVMLATATPALAKSYSLDSTDIEATVNSDGSMDVVQKRVVDFDGSFVLLMIPLGDDTDVEISSVTVQFPSSATATQLPEVEFQSYWRSYGNPDLPSWALDTSDNTLYVFSGYDNTEATVSVYCTYPHAITAYNDCAELYWQFVSDVWEQSSYNVTCNIKLPVPSGTTVGNEDVRVWGHGPLSGDVKNNGDGTATYTISEVDAGVYAEARVVFPTSWLDLSSVTNTKNSDYLDTILSQEKQWADSANAQRMAQAAIVFISVGLCVALIVVSVLVWLKWGKEFKPSFSGDYWRDAPEKGLHPILVGRVVSWNQTSSNELVTALMWLTQKGYVTIDATTTTQKGLLKDKQVGDYLIKLKKSADAELDEIDQAAMKLLFNDVAGGADSLTFSSINDCGKANPETFQTDFQAFQTQVDMAVENGQFFETKSEMIANTYRVLGIVMIIFAFFSLLILENFVPMFFAFVSAIVFFVFSGFMRKRTQRGADVNAKAIALKKWLKDFSTLDERPPTDIKVWGEFMVYAFVLGVAKEAIAQLKVSVPELFTGEGIYESDTLPWWFWYSSFNRNDGVSSQIFQSGTDFFQTTMNNTMSSISSAIDVLHGGGSDFGGFSGGGFSGGGGGGFGGGGFGGAR